MEGFKFEIGESVKVLRGGLLVGAVGVVKKLMVSGRDLRPGYYVMIEPFRNALYFGEWQLEGVKE